jgi:hypothetical protein
MRNFHAYAQPYLRTVRGSTQPVMHEGDEEKPVVRIYYNNSDAGAADAPPDQAVARLTQEIGSNPSCTDNNARKTRCAWHSPPGVPDERTIDLRHAERSFKLTKENPEWPKGPLQARATTGTAFHPVIPLGEIELGVPSGVTVGMLLAKVHTGLTAAIHVERLRPRRNGLHVDFDPLQRSEHYH